MKKILSVLLVVTLILTTGVPAFGAEADSVGLEKAITAAKNVVIVPDSFTDFNYSTSQNTVNGTTYTYWNLTWNDVSSGGSMYVTIDENGNLTNYYYYNNMNEPDRNQQGLSKITKVQALKTAAEFLTKAVPGYGNRMKQIVNQELGVYGTEYQLNFKLYVNDIPVDFINATVSVNRYTGEISNYYFNGVIGDLNLISYPAPTGVVGFDAAGKAYISEIGMDLKYYSYYDYIKKTLKVFSTYETTVNGKAIDAKTGKVVDLFFDDYGYPMAGGAGGKDKGAPSEQPVSEFTKEEQVAIENTNGLIDKSAAEAVARSFGTNFGELKTISLSNSYVEKEKYFWNMEFELGYASVNAATSELTGFSLNMDYTNKGGSITQERAKVLAEE
ncbi:MAG TPA: YcdB/YcdC domain-containing protein, partial [Clostridia bacterium]|nr:YcdB/YcdC domain-containing protein [Clostridia bacterium]